jgi:tol-pal system protein YbgF
MKRISLLIAILMLSPAFAPAANRDMIELQRDVAQLQDQVRDLQRSFDEKFAALQVLVQQNLDMANKSNQSLQEAGRQQAGITDRVVGPMVGLSSKMDQLSNDVSAMREAVNDVTVRMNKVQQQLTDLNNAAKASSLPVAPPPGPDSATSPAPVSDNSSSGMGPVGGSTAGPPPVKATTLYENALRDMQSGKADLALSEFQDYIRFYNDTDLAPNAQFYIGQIHYSQEQFDQAIQEYDKVLEAYPNNNKTAAAHFYKGKVLFQLGKRTAAAKEFQAVVAEFPNSDVAPGARAQLKVLGINPGPAPARKKRST